MNISLIEKYIPVERATKDAFLKQLSALHARGELSFLAIDEAHSISSWGHDFRPQYRQLSVLKERFPDVATVALTATATKRVCVDIVQSLALRSPRQFRLSFNRPNIFYEVVCAGVAEADHGSVIADMQQRIFKICELINKSNKSRDKKTPKRSAAAPTTAAASTSITVRGVVGIVYCHKRDSCDAVAAQLRAGGFRAAAYHSGAKDRSNVLKEWTAGNIDVVVSYFDFFLFFFFLFSFFFFFFFLVFDMFPKKHNNSCDFF